MQAHFGNPSVTSNFPVLVIILIDCKVCVVAIM